MADQTATSGSDAGNLEDLEPQLARYRSELTGYCYRMLGSSFEAEDAVQETFVRAWKAYDRFEGRAALRSWLYRIATNVCFDLLNGRNRRARPMDLGPAWAPDAQVGATLPEETWIEPIPDDNVGIGTVGADPADLAANRESIRLAFVAALQHLPPRQRAVLILREVLRWKADEVADLLGTSVPSVNSALQRARATLAASDLGATGTDGADGSAGPAAGMDETHEELLARYVEAFERFDIESLVKLLADDAMHTMPPFPLWLQGPEAISTWMLGPGIECKGSRLVTAVAANGSPAFGQYRARPDGTGHYAWSLQVLEIEGGEITGITYFLDVDRVFPMFGLPLTLDEPSTATAPAS